MKDLWVIAYLLCIICSFGVLGVALEGRFDDNFAVCRRHATLRDDDDLFLIVACANSSCCHDSFGYVECPRPAQTMERLSFAFDAQAAFVALCTAELRQPRLHLRILTARETFLVTPSLWFHGLNLHRFMP